MQFRKLLQDEDAVSPVIGVILMVAITVILAAVIASFVLGLGDTSDPSPSTSFEWNYDSSGQTLEIVHDGGDSFTAGQVEITGSTTYGHDGNTWDTYAGTANSEVSAGDRITLTTTNGNAVQSDYEIELVWTSEDGETTDTIGKDSGPDA